MENRNPTGSLEKKEWSPLSILRVQNRKIRCECNSFACRACAKNHQDNFVQGVRRLFDALSENGVFRKWNFLTVIPHLDRLTAGEALDDYIRRVKTLIEARLDIAGVNTFIGGLDFSYNIDDRRDENEFRPHWSVHVHGFVPVREFTHLIEKKLRESFKSSSAVPRPVNIKLFDGSDDAIAYAMKPNFWLRTTKLQRSLSQSGKPRSSRNSTSSLLPPKQYAELQQALHALSLNDRMILVGVDVWPAAGLMDRRLD